MKWHVSRSGFTLIEMLVVILIIAILIGLLLPVAQQARGSALRVQCQNNLRSVGQGCFSYYDQNNRFPPGLNSQYGSVDAMASNQWYVSWMARILPFVDYEGLSKTIPGEYDRIIYPWGYAPVGDERPHAGLGTEVAFYKCPSESRNLVNPEIDLGWMVTPIALTSYLGNDGTMCGTNDGILYDNSTVTFAMITDGPSNTILAGERPPSADLYFGWWYAGAGYWDPTYGQIGVGDVVLGARETVYVTDPFQQFGADCPASKVYFQPGTVDDPCDQVHFWSLHPGGANFVFADGSVRFLTYEANSILPALATRAGGEVFDFVD